MLSWANRFNICCFLDSHDYNFVPSSAECLVAVGTLHTYDATTGSALNGFSKFCSNHNDWIFGHLTYDLKNELEELESSNQDYINFPNLFFFVPEVVLILSGSELKVGAYGDGHSKIFDAIRSCTPVEPNKSTEKTVTEIRSRFTKQEYIDVVRSIKEHILRGDCYEMNFCQEFYAEKWIINPENIFSKLASRSPNPFSAYYKLNDCFCMCASPERYIRRQGNRIISQPIKGTSARVQDDPKQDQNNIERLRTNEKDRSENVMIVDLVRNDLSKVCVEGSVVVDELFGIYSFPNVHQMISTIAGELKPGVSLADIIAATFPMGSMTGAPKKKVMELIDKFERTKRGLFSGSIGYMDPDGNFDFNVVIRSLLYNESNQYISFQAGSAITFNSEPEQEYEECLLKVSTIKKVLED